MRDTRREVLHFWFEEIEPRQWFEVNPAFDKQVRDRFQVIYNMACEGLCNAWQEDADGAVALCIVLDQFPRNMFRDTARAYESDDTALLTAKYAVSRGYNHILPPVRRKFLYMPYMHSESLSDQNKCVDLFEAMKNDDPVSHDYAVKHMKVIEQFGRFPHRNSVLGRAGTPEEAAFLAEQGPGF